MKKFSVIFLILFLILFTAFIKNSTKRIDDEIFATKESIRTLEKEFGELKLEYNYLSSGEKLMYFQNKHFKEILKPKKKHEYTTAWNNRPRDTNQHHARPSIAIKRHPTTKNEQT